VPKEFSEIFGGSPVSAITIFRQTRQKDPASAWCAIKLKGLKDGYRLSNYVLQQGTASFDTASRTKSIDAIGRINFTEPRAGFISIGFASGDCSEPLRPLLDKYYNVESPWCMPAWIIHGEGGIWLKFDWSEIPLPYIMDKYKNIK
jgi:hypothetical protein